MDQWGGATIYIYIYHVYIYIYMYMCVYIYVLCYSFISVLTYFSVNVPCACIHIYIYTYIHIYIYVHTHTRMARPSTDLIRSYPQPIALLGPMQRSSCPSWAFCASDSSSSQAFKPSWSQHPSLVKQNLCQQAITNQETQTGTQ